MHLSRSTPRHITIKTAKVTQGILKTERKNRVIYKGTPIRLSADFPEETLKTKRKQHDIFKVLRGKNL